MIGTTRRLCVLAFVLGLGITDMVRAQCPEYATGFGPAGGGVSGAIYAQAVFDDGSGPTLYVGGYFHTAGNFEAESIAKWDGTQWSSLGAGLPNGIVYALATFDDGTGPALYVGGSFSAPANGGTSGIAKWDGVSWSTVGGGIAFGGTVSSLVVHDDGSGPALYASGTFSTAGSVSVPGLARWNGSTWSAVGTDTQISSKSMIVFDDGGGAKLYAGGTTLKRWDGSTWSVVGTGTTGRPNCMAVYDDGSGPALYVSCTSDIVKWDGNVLSNLGSGLGANAVESMAAFDDGGGQRLYVGGSFTTAGGVPATNLASWNGSVWSTPGGSPSLWYVGSLAVFDLGRGSRLYAAGKWTTSTGFVDGIGSWDGSVWRGFQNGRFQGIDGIVHAFAQFDDGTGPALYAGGSITEAGDVSVGGLAKWNGTSWSNPGIDFGIVYAMTVFDDGTGPALVVGGTSPTHAAKWDGLHWTTLGGLDGTVQALAVYDDGTGAALYAGGSFTGGFRRWNGSTWTVVGGGTDDLVDAMIVHDDGNGPGLFIAGKFHSPALRIAKWSGSWSALGCGLGYPTTNDSVAGLTVFDFGAGPRLVAGGVFGYANCVASAGVVSWDGTVFSNVGNPPLTFVRCVIGFDDGHGPKLYAAGSVGIERWDGFGWAVLGEIPSGSLWAAGTFDDGSANGPRLFFGGDVSVLRGVATSGIAQWQGCPGPSTGFCFGDGRNNTICPCWNAGALEHGCENSALTGGAVLASSGQTSPDSVVLTSSGELPQALTVFIQGSTTTPPTHYGDGLRCVGGTLKRLFIKSASGGVVSAPGTEDPSITARSASAGDPISPGTTRYYQAYYRDSSPGFCPSPSGSTFNISNGLRITW